MSMVAISKKINTIDTFEVKGEKFVVLKKDYLDELVVLMRSFAVGEKMLKDSKTRSFSDFFRNIPKRKK